MKKLIIAIIALVFSAQITNAQTEKGRQNLGLNLKFTYLKDNGVDVVPNSAPVTWQNTNKNFNIGPDYSYFIADNLDLGATIYYELNSQENVNNSSYGQNSHGFGANIYIRKYFMYADKIGLRTGARIGYGHNKASYNSSYVGSIYNYDAINDSYNAGLGLDIVYYPAKKLGISASIADISYSHTKETDSNTGKASADGFTFNLVNSGITMSVYYVFGGK